MLTSPDNLKLPEDSTIDSPSSAVSPSKSFAIGSQLALPSPTTLSFNREVEVSQSDGSVEVEEVE